VRACADRPQSRNGSTIWEAEWEGARAERTLTLEEGLRFVFRAVCSSGYPSYRTVSREHAVCSPTQSQSRNGGQYDLGGGVGGGGGARRANAYS